MQLVPRIFLHQQPIEQILKHFHDVPQLEELFILQLVLRYVFWEVVQQKWVHEVNDIFHVGSGRVVGSGWVALIQAPRKKYHKHEELVEERGFQLSPVDLNEELAENVVTCVLIEVLFLVVFWLGLFVVGIDLVEVRRGA